jgi:hypothetical protein
MINAIPAMQDGCLPINLIDYVMVSEAAEPIRGDFERNGVRVLTADQLEQALGGLTPHLWRGDQWECMRCGEVHTDPCQCPCHVEAH